MNVQPLLESLPDPVLAVGPGTELLYANRAAEERFGMRLEDHVGVPQLDRVHVDDQVTAVSSLASVVHRTVGTLIEIRLRDHSGRYAPYEIRGRAWPGGPPGSIVMVLRETTQRRQWELAAGDPAMLGAIFDRLPAAAVVLDPDGTVRAANRALSRFVRRPLEELLGSPLSDVFVAEDRESVSVEVGAATGQSDPRSFEARLVDADGGDRPVAVTVVDLLDDRSVEGTLVAIADISSLVETRNELAWLASHDPLTGLMNRSTFVDVLGKAQNSPAAASHLLLFCDVDDLKVINDEHGHRSGDAVLITVADRLRYLVRPADAVARLSGDEFAVLLTDANPGALGVVRDRIDRLMIEPISLPNGAHVQVTVSVGGTSVQPAVPAGDLLDAADAAMYRAKRDRRGTGTLG